MGRIDRRGVIASLGAAGLAGCVEGFEIGSRKKPPRGGIGGTGIVGTLTDFGSLLVNGLMIGVDETTVMTDAFGSIDLAGLAVGQSLTIEASDEGGRLLARRVHVTHPVIGLVEQANGSRAVVAGVPVRLEDGAIGQFSNGTRVAVSGLWRGGLVIASRVDALPDAGPSVIAGAVHQIADVNVGGVPLVMQGAQQPGPGTFATAYGDWDATALRATRVESGRFVGAAGPLVELSVEGFLDQTVQAPYYAISGLGHSFDADALLYPLFGRRAVFSGAYDGDFVVESGLVLPENLARRRQSLGSPNRVQNEIRRVPTR